MEVQETADRIRACYDPLYLHYARSYSGQKHRGSLSPFRYCYCCMPDRAEPEILALYLEETTKLRAFLIAKHTEDYYAITIQQSKQKKLHRCLRRL